MRVEVHASPFHSIYHQSCGVLSSWEGRYTPPISPLPFSPLWCRLWVFLYTGVWAHLTDMHETRMLKGTGPRNRIQKLWQKWIIGSNKEPLVFLTLTMESDDLCLLHFLLQAARVKYMWEKIFTGVYCQITWRLSLFPVGLLDAFLILLFGNCSICNLIVWLGGPQQNEDIFFVWRWNYFDRNLLKCRLEHLASIIQ